jgi:hypothetical protein
LLEEVAGYIATVRLRRIRRGGGPGKSINLEPRQPFAAPAVETSPMTFARMGMWITR